MIAGHIALLGCSSRHTGGHRVPDWFVLLIVVFKGLVLLALLAFMLWRLFVEEPRQHAVDEARRIRMEQAAREHRAQMETVDACTVAIRRFSNCMYVAHKPRNECQEPDCREADRIIELWRQEPGK